MRLFQDLVPERYLWVSVDGSDLNVGSREAPFGSIQAAVDAATPGTAVLVRSGTYHENVKVKSSGTEQEPIWIVSADGEHEATIVPLSETVSTVYGRGTDNVVFSGFRIDGAEQQHAIEFTQAGHDYHNWVENLVIENNLIYSTGLDGIKLAQARHVEVIGNTVIGGSEEAIDLVTVSDAVLQANEISGLDGRSGITVKGGSERILISKNAIKDVGADGITVGGWTDKTLLAELSLDFQASNVVVKENLIQNVEKRAINVLGGQDTLIEDNYIDPNNDYSATINIQHGRWGLSSSNITIENNIVTRKDWLVVNRGQGDELVVENNRQSGAWDHEVGPSAAGSSGLSWLGALNGRPEPAPPTSSPALSDLVTSWQIDRLFDGVDDHQVMEHEAWLALDAGTISFNFAPDDVEGIQGLVSKDAKFFGDGGHLSVWLEGDHVVARLQSEDSSYTLRSDPGSVAAHADTHLALTFGDDGFKLYLDGLLADMNAYGGGLEGNREPIVMGGRAVYSSEASSDVVTDFFRGTIGEFRVDDTVLDAAAIGALSGRPEPAPPTSSPAPSDLVTSWQIDRLFDGVDDHQIIEDHDALRVGDGAITVSFTPGDTFGIQALVSKDAQFFGDGGHFTMYLQGERLFARLQDKSTSYTLESAPGAIKAGKETVAKVDFGSNGMRLLIDDDVVDTNDFVGGIEGNGEDLIVGASAIYSPSGQNSALTNFFRGEIGDLTIEDHDPRLAYMGDLVDEDDRLFSSDFDAFAG